MADFSDTFETGDTSAWTEAAGTVSVETDIVHNGNYALKCTSGYDIHGYVAYPQAAYMKRVSFWVYIDAWQKTCGVMRLFGVGPKKWPNSYGRYALSLYLTHDRHLWFNGGSVSYWPTTVGYPYGMGAQLQLGQWYRVSFSYRAAIAPGGAYNTTKQYKVYLDGVPEIAGSLYSYTQFGIAMNIGCSTPCWDTGESTVLRFDNIHYDDTDSTDDIGDL